MKSSYDNIDSPYVRFLGWLPKHRENKIFLVLNLLVFGCGIFVWPWLPGFHIGLFPAPWFYHLGFTVLASVMWSIYTKKYWYAWYDNIEGENDEGVAQ